MNFFWGVLPYEKNTTIWVGKIVVPTVELIRDRAKVRGSSSQGGERNEVGGTTRYVSQILVTGFSQGGNVSRK